jgi:2-iminoacetate synthase ThiH
MTFSLDALGARILDGGRLTADEALWLYREAPTMWLGRMADAVRRRKHPHGVVSYIIEGNVNYTNVCVARCNFCAFYRTVGPRWATCWLRRDPPHRRDDGARRQPAALQENNNPICRWLA